MDDCRGIYANELIIENKKRKADELEPSWLFFTPVDDMRRGSINIYTIKIINIYSSNFLNFY